jgi:hypothetical protein
VAPVAIRLVLDDMGGSEEARRTARGGTSPLSTVRHGQREARHRVGRSPVHPAGEVAPADHIRGVGSVRRPGLVDLGDRGLSIAWLTAGLLEWVPSGLDSDPGPDREREGGRLGPYACQAVSRELWGAQMGMEGTTDVVRGCNCCRLSSHKRFLIG